MFVRDYPPAADLAQADGQTKFQLNSLPVRLLSGTAHEGSDERYIIACGNVHLVYIKNTGILRPGEEQIPSLPVRFKSF